MLFQKGQIPWNKGTKGLMPIPWNKGKIGIMPFPWNKGKKMSKEFCQKLSEAHKDQIPWCKGKHISEETKEKLRKINLGRKQSAETKQKMSEAHKGRISGMLGKHHSLESRKKISKAFKKEKHPNWKGGIYHYSGRILLYKSKRKYVRRSRLVAEKCLGRFLTKLEVIHHINQVKNDDRPENLYLFPSLKEHTRYHFIKSKPKLKSNITRGL